MELTKEFAYQAIADFLLRSRLFCLAQELHVHLI